MPDKVAWCSSDVNGCTEHEFSTTYFYSGMQDYVARMCFKHSFRLNP